METAIFGAGCFWGIESAFQKLPGVLQTEVGYAGGHTEKPTYEQVCSHQTGHAEVVRVVFDPAIISYEELLDVFWKIHDPTSMNRQGPDVGSQYRSIIFYNSPEQKAKAFASKTKLEQDKIYAGKIVTEIIAATPFNRAEEYHQHFHEKQKRFR